MEIKAMGLTNYPNGISSFGIPIYGGSPDGQPLVTGALIVLCRLGRVTEQDARAIVVSGEGRRSQVERLWDRLASSYLKK
jgi:hypothetical protein